MANPTQLYVDDTSPSITYYPFGDTFGAPDPSAGWNPYYTGSGYAAFQGQTGKGTSLHRTSLDGASFSLQWNGTGIQLFGNASQASYDLTLDGTSSPANSSSLADGILADFQGLNDTSHTVTLTVHTSSSPSPDTFVAFDQALITSALVDNNTTLLSQTVNDSDIAFLGHWSYKAATSDNGQDVAFHYSISSGDRAQITFHGRTVSVTGFVSDVSGQYSVTLDNRTANLSGHSSFLNSDTLLYYATGLDDDSQHELVIQNMEDNVLALKVGGFNYTAVQHEVVPSSTPTPSAPSNASSTSNHGVLAGIVLASVISFILLALVFGYFLVYRPRTRRRGHQGRVQRRLDKEVEAAGRILDISTYSEGNIGRRSSSGTSLKFTGWRFATESQQSNSDASSFASDESWHSSKKGPRTSQRGSQGPWEYTIDLPVISPKAPSEQQQNPSPSRSIGSTTPRTGHSRMESGARLISDQAAHDSDEDDVASIHASEYDHYYAAELSLSPRTSEAANFTSGVRTSAWSNDGNVDDADQSTMQMFRPSSEAPHLDIMEPSPFAVDFVGTSGWRESKGLSRSRLSQVQSAAESNPTPEPDTKRRRTSQEGKRLSVRFDTSARSPSIARSSFLDFGPNPSQSSSLNEPSSLSAPQSERERSQLSAATIPDRDTSAPEPEPPSASRPSVIFNEPPVPTRPQGPRSPLPSHNSPRYSQTFGTDRTRPQRASTLSIPQQLVPMEVSPTDSVPMTVSDIYFRRVVDSEGASRRTSTASQLMSPPPPLPSTSQSLPDTPRTPLIVQKLLGMSTSSPSTPTPASPPAQVPQEPTPEPPAAQREVAEPSTPLMQRILGIGPSVLNPKHHRNPSLDVTKPSSESSRPGGFGS